MCSTSLFVCTLCYKTPKGMIRANPEEVNQEWFEIKLHSGRKIITKHKSINNFQKQKSKNHQQENQRKSSSGDKTTRQSKKKCSKRNLDSRGNKECSVKV